MLNKLNIAYNYITACQTQTAYEQQIDLLFKAINPDNQLFGLADPLRQTYEELVYNILGEETMDWIEYWQYEADYGKESRDFAVNDVEYNTQDMTLYKFLEVACGLTK